MEYSAPFAELKKAKKIEKTKEKKLEKALRQLIMPDKGLKIKPAKGLCIKLLAFGFIGLPDRLCLLPGGVIFFVEVKTEGKTLTGRQKFVRRQISNLGFKVWLLDSEEVLTKIKTEYDL